MQEGEKLTRSSTHSLSLGTAGKHWNPSLSVTRGWASAPREVAKLVISILEGM